MVKSLLLAAALVIPSSVAADVSYNGFSVNGDQALVLINASVRNVEAGEITLGSVPPTIAWCLDLIDTLQSSGTFTVGSSSGLIGGIMAEVPSSPSTTLAAEAQIAMWETIYGGAFSLLLINGAPPSMAFTTGVASLIANAVPMPFTTFVPPAGSGNQEMGMIPVPGPVVGSFLPGLAKVFWGR